MLKAYLKLAFRTILKHKEYSLINLVGLTLGIVAAVFIWQYVAFEKSYDRFHSKADQIYRIPIHFYNQGELETTDAMNFAPTGPALKTEFPEVIEFVRFTPEYDRVVLSVGEQKYEETKLFYADSSVFKVFDFPLIDGEATSCLIEPGSIVLTQSVAERYFGPRDQWRESPVGKTIRYNNQRPLLITGVMEDVPAHSHIQFHALLSFTTFIENGNDPSAEWGWNDFYTYVLLRPDADQEAFAAKLPAFLRRHKTYDVAGTYDEFLVQPLTSIHLNSNLGYEAEPNGDAKTIRFLLLIGFAILFIAWVNYINLATARAEERANEVGVRKVVGASREGLIAQFLMEALVLNTLAVLVAVVFILALGPLLGTLMGKAIPFSFSQLPLSYGLIPVLILVGTLLAGLYPAFVMSTFSPASTLKGSAVQKRRRVWLRQGLVVFQYAVSIVLIVGTVSVSRQLQFMKDQDLGFSLEQTLVLNAPGTMSNDSIFQQRFSSFKNDISQYPAIQAVTSSSAIPGKHYLDLDSHGGLYLQGRNEEEAVNFSTFRVADNFVDFYEMELVAGRSFSADRPADHNALIVNESGLSVLGLQEPEEAMGKKIMYWGTERPIVGVVKDYHHKSLRNEIEPMILRNSKGTHLYFSVRFVAADQAAISQVMAQVQGSWNRVYPDDPFNHFFLDEHFNEQYLADNQLATITGLFSLLTIFIACLGLFGLASYTVTVRAKEIGIRKVLGASNRSIVFLFSKGYLPLLTVAILLGLPLAYYLSSHWLANYAFAISFHPGLFVWPCVLVLGIAFVAVGTQSLRAATENPIEVLRKE